MSGNKSATYLAIDIGASSGRHIVGRLEDGKLVTREVHRFYNGAIRTGGGLYWESDRLVGEVISGLCAAKAQGLAPDYVGIDTWGVDYALLTGDASTDGVRCYRDDRTAAVVDEVHGIVPFAELYARTGIQFQQFNTIYQLFEDKKSGRAAAADGMLMLPDFLGYKLTGVKKQEYTNATTTGLVNAVTHTWDYAIIDRLGLDRRFFGELSQPGTAVGRFSPEVERAVGYSATVVLPATHDTASAVLAAPLEGSSPYISSGTWSLLGIEQEAAHTDENSRAVNYSNEGSICGAFRYQKNIMGLWMLQSVKRELREAYGFPELAELARGAKRGATVDVNDKRFLAPKSMIDEICRAVWRRLDTPALLRVIYDSLADGYAEAVRELECNTGKTYDSINIIGGGCRDAFLNELTAKATGKRVITGPIEATSIGNLIMQMIGCGELKDLAAARRTIKNSFEITEVK